MLAIAAVAITAACVSNAASVETLLMPGPVSAGHAKFESECTSCHDRSNRERQSELCLGCHKEIAADVRRSGGFHGRMANAGTAGQCQACHSEHQGRDADIVHMDVTQFDHRRTDFALDGAHRGLTCANCHASGQPWRNASGNCVSCHTKDDIHGGQLGKDCAACHTTTTWAKGRYDHSTTRFSLTGAHQAVSCGACHLGARYQATPQTCVGCHATDDAHRGERGSQCGSCHTTQTWQTAKFDHGRETGFALTGRHAQLNCGNCHRTGRFEDQLPKDCFGCHRADDSHAGRFGSACADCHGNDRWQPVAYDHAARTGFALLGAHTSIDCHACHTAAVDRQKLGTDCASCHLAANPHGRSSPTACDSCHSQGAWSREISFDHDLTKFPLLGLHNVVSCAQCHRTKDFAAAPARCVDCHTSQDVHRGALGAQCDTCHSPNSWAQWKFDHGRQTGFALTGAHAKEQCADCHRRPASEVKLSRECVACHQRDDVHAGQFGRQCDRCHTTVTFAGGRAR